LGEGRQKKESFVPSLSEAFTGSGGLPQHVLGADVQVENQLCIAGSRQARLPLGSREACVTPLHIGEVQKRDFSPKCNASGVFPGMAHLPTVPGQGCAPKDERHAAVCAGIPPPFCAFGSYKSCLGKVERVCRRRRCVWRITA